MGRALYLYRHKHVTRWFSDKELLKRLSAIFGEAFVAGVEKELMDARTADYSNEGGMGGSLAAIHKRFT